jgi:hypothetical protein
LNVLAVARVVRREMVRRPLHLALLVASAATVLLATVLATFGFGRETALAQEGGLHSIALYAFATAILFGAGAVGRDLESRLLVTILARPVRRRDYLLGRFVGILQTTALGTIPLTAVLLIGLALTDAGPAAGSPSVPVPLLGAAVLLALFQTAALAAAVLALSVLVPPTLSLVVAVLVAAGGMLVEPARQSLPADLSLVVDIPSRVLSLLFPPLAPPAEGAAVAFDRVAPLGRMALGAGRCVIYSALALSLAGWRLGRKDLT